MKILYTGRDLRSRRRDTIQHAPKPLTFVAQQSLHAMKADHELSYNEHKSLWKKLVNVLRFSHLIPRSDLRGIDVVYSPGKTVWNAPAWVVEIDNVAVLAYYKPWLVTLTKPFLERSLASKSCKRIICLSNAAKQGMQETFSDKRIHKKLCVVYPYCEQKTSIAKSKQVEFLFVSTHFYLKGGREVVETFLRHPNKSMHLTLITRQDDILPSLRARIRKAKNITLIDATLSREETRKYFAQAHVLCVPTAQDSFGMVFLEALSYGLPIIATNIYNLPELVQNEKNGILVDPPFHYFHPTTNTPNAAVWSKDVSALMREHTYPAFQTDVTKAILALAQDKRKREQMARASTAHFKKYFAPNVWKRSLAEALR